MKNSFECCVFENITSKLIFVLNILAGNSYLFNGDLFLFRSLQENKKNGLKLLLSNSFTQGRSMQENIKVV
jgi:hypothetical protein